MQAVAVANTPSRTPRPKADEWLDGWNSEVIFVSFVE
jgi:hypothetical protein